MKKVSLTEEERQEVLRYGVERVGMESLFFCFVVLVSLVLDTLWYGLVFWFSFCVIRRYAGGYHADTRKRCGLISATTVILIFLCIKYVHLNFFLYIPLQVGCSVVIMLLAPVDNKNRVLEDEERHSFRRKARLSVTCLLAISVCLYCVECLNTLKSIMLACVVVALSLVGGVLKKYITEGEHRMDSG